MHRTPIRGLPAMAGSRIFLYGGRSKDILCAKVPQAALISLRRNPAFHRLPDPVRPGYHNSPI